MISDEIRNTGQEPTLFIIKRSGERMPFEDIKITRAMENANTDVALPADRLTDTEITEITQTIHNYAESLTRDLSVEEIQDLVEENIMSHGKFKLARAYMMYRYKHNDKRKMTVLDKRIQAIIDNTSEDAAEENANKNPTVLSVQRDYIAGEWSRYYTNKYLLPNDILKAHNEGIIHFHDSDYFAQHSHNCELVNLEDMLQNGTKLSGVPIYKPKSFATAATLTSQIIATVASFSYGGQTISLAHLAPFVDISRQKIKKRLTAELKESNVTANTAQIDEMVEKEVRKEVEAGCQTIQYQLITLQTTNGQAPFVSIFMYLNEVPEGRTRDDLALLIEVMLKQRTAGIDTGQGWHMTPAFPKLLYVLQSNNIKPGQKYFYLTELAARCTAKRLVPDYISEKIMKELKGDVYPCMGCVAGETAVTYRYCKRTYTESFEAFWNRMAEHFPVMPQLPGSPNLMIPLSNVKIHNGTQFVNCSRIIRNASQETRRISFTDTFVYGTADHPFFAESNNNARDTVRADHLTHNLYVPKVTLSNYVKWYNSDNAKRRLHPNMAYLIGAYLACGKIRIKKKGLRLELKLNWDAPLATHLKIILHSLAPNAEIECEPKGNGIRITCTDNHLAMRLEHYAENHLLPANFNEYSRETLMNILAGLADCIGNPESMDPNSKGLLRTHLASSNQALLHQMHIFLNILEIPNRLRVYTEMKGKCVYDIVVPTALLPLCNMFGSMTELEKLLPEDQTSNDRLEAAEIINTESDAFTHTVFNAYLPDDKTSPLTITRKTCVTYDVTTDSSSFAMSGIISHNCRSFLTPDRFTDKYGNLANAGNYDGKHKYYGRMNQGVVTISLPDVALSSHGDMDKFWKILDERLELCHRALRIRHEHLKGTPSDIAPIIWQDGACARLKPGETIDKLLYHGYSTISLGYAGLAECVYYMTKSSHTKEPGKSFGLQVMQALNDACNKWKAEEDIDYSVYGSPIESTTYKFAKCLQRRFGIIEGVTDKNYVTNSYHCKVTENISAFDKLSIESEFQKLSPGGWENYIA